MTVTTTVMQDIERLRDEQKQLDEWLDSHKLCDGHSPQSSPGACARCDTLNYWDGLNRSLERLLRFGKVAA